MSYEGTAVQPLFEYLRDPSYIDAGAYVLGMVCGERTAFDPYYVGQSSARVYKRVVEFVANVDHRDHRVPNTDALRSATPFTGPGFRWAYFKGQDAPPRRLLDPAACAALQPHIRAFLASLHVFCVPVLPERSHEAQALNLEAVLGRAFDGQIGRRGAIREIVKVRLGAGAEHLQVELDSIKTNQGRTKA